MGIRDTLAALFGPKRPSNEQPKGGIEVVAQLNHLLMPMDRGSRYEDPLQEALSAEALGEVAGGGTMVLESGEVEYIDVQVVLNDVQRGVQRLIERLETFGAPKGSTLRIYDRTPAREIAFGKAEGVAVYLDGVNLPNEVYASSDVNVVIEELSNALAGRGEMHGHWEGPRETALYFYGESAEEMKNRMSDFLASYPLCAGARVVTIAPPSATHSSAR